MPSIIMLIDLISIHLTVLSFFVTDMEQDYPDFTTEDEMCSLTLILDDGCRLYVHKEVLCSF